MTRTEQVRTIQEAYYDIPAMQDGFMEVREYLFDMNKAQEKRHRNGSISSHPVCFSITDASKLFVVRHLLDGFAQPDRFSVDDIISIRNEVLYAQAYAKRFHDVLTPWADKWAAKFSQVDYAELMKEAA